MLTIYVVEYHEIILQRHKSEVIPPIMFVKIEKNIRLRRGKKYGKCDIAFIECNIYINYIISYKLY